ncbi:hypothetical protein [Streptomyces sp. IB2014 016-6]|uniref:hypothetical protein n=1 Tax=Streptomyces sp. IB2014 016-6 TaxID=2517818 RepID=UPI0011C7474A|nr:hypothetical protein [Streptomyces sp. IB2014 016-6]TXL91624.1 hypothetical protein EW053_04675 [Streptomyces sp. IB2014 016-6]
MGSRLYVEVLDYAPETLTHREKLFLAVLADDARDTTRVTWSSVESPKTLRRGKVSRAQVYEVIKALISKGCLERVTAGQKNGTAKYRILPLQCPEIPDADTSAQRPDSADTDAESQRPENADTDPESQCPENPDTDESQCPEIPDVSVRESRTPTLSPLSTRPLSFGDDPSEPPGQDDAEPEPEIEAEIVTAQVIVGEWLERCAIRPPSAVIGQMSKQIRVLLDEDHIHPDLIRRGIATWMQKRLHPSTLPSVVNEVMNAPVGGPTARQAPGNNLYDEATGTTVFDRARARAAARTAQEGPTP